MLHSYSTKVKTTHICIITYFNICISQCFLSCVWWHFIHIALPVSFYIYIFETVLYKYMDVYLNNL